MRPQAAQRVAARMSSGSSERPRLRGRSLLKRVRPGRLARHVRKQMPCTGSGRERRQAPSLAGKCPVGLFADQRMDILLKFFEDSQIAQLGILFQHLGGV